MDDTQQSRVSDAAAAATRKRRSSILKSQRPARTPFSELEFNVATPTDTAKSRRVSFSKRTGVAEFITNEATTTWKNFYEEHNKSLESSGNDSDANASRQPVGHLGKRIFDQQFEVVESFDLIGTGTVFPPINADGSLNNVNFTEQLASLECTADGKLTAPQSKFELSALTDQQSKLFGNDFTVQCNNETFGQINVNFSAMQPVGNDDLDEIQKDIERVSNMVCHGAFSDGQNMSEYIEVDLNTTHIAIKNEEDMSITDTIHSPKVQDVSKSCSIDKKVSLSKDWVTDKENIAINPYIAPHESANFAINDEPDQVLVFDGKRLTLQSEKLEKDKNKDYRQTLLPNSSAETPQRKTIVLNVNDDLPNFADDILHSKSENSGLYGGYHVKSNTIYDNDISMTLPVNKSDIISKRKSTHDNTGNISMTQALPTNIIDKTVEIGKEISDILRTLVYDEDTGNISVTQALPAKIITNNAKMPERRRTVVYENDTGNISITQVVPSNILVTDKPEKTEKRKTIVFDEESGNISITQGLSSNIIIPAKDSEKRKTIVFDDDGGNISITQALSANIVLSDNHLQLKERTITYEDDTGNISVTQALPSNVIITQKNESVVERRRTVVYEDDTGNISVTQALPSNIIQENIKLDVIQKFNDVATVQTLPNNVIRKDSDTNRRRTIVYEDDTGDISFTQAIPSQLIPGYTENNNVTSNVVDESTQLKAKSSKIVEAHKRMTIVYDNDGDVSITQARNTIIFDHEDANISMTRPIPANVFLLDKLDSAADRSFEKTNENKVFIEEENKDLNEIANEEVSENVTDYRMYEQDAQMVDAPAVDDTQEARKNVVFHSGDCDAEAEMSFTEAIPKVQSFLQETEKRQTIVFDNDHGNISMTKPIPAELIEFQAETLNKSKNKDIDSYEEVQAPSSCPAQDVLVYQATTTNSMPKMVSIRAELSDSKSDRPSISVSNSETKETSSYKTNDDVITLPQDFCNETISIRTEDVASEDQSITKYPPVEEKIEIMNLKQPSSITLNGIDVGNEARQETADVNVETEEIEEVRETKVNAILEMSDSIISGTEEKSLMTQIASNHSSVNTEKHTDASSESMFYIMRDSDDEVQTDREVDVQTVGQQKLRLKLSNTTTFVNQSPDGKNEGDPVLVTDLEKKLAQLKTVNDKKPTSVNQLYEKIVSSALEELEEKNEKEQLLEQSMCFQKANDTKELLEMISDFTDKKEEHDNEQPMKASGPKAMGNKSMVTEPKRLSFAPNRQSIILSREDLLTNISMAQAALQKSRLELDESDSTEEDTGSIAMEHSISEKSGRTSSEVVKTLHFEDESLSETSFKGETKASPLKKTAFGETSYMSESKAKVIPTYLKDVSDGMKALMLDLVKPMTDTMPFEGGGLDRAARKAPSTHSTHVQANLITSSQIDIDCELYVPESSSEMGYVKESGLDKSRSRSFRSPGKPPTNSSERSSEFDVSGSRQRCIYSQVPVSDTSPQRVLVFDHLNPLNNILLGTLDYTEAHSYNPRCSGESLHDEPKRSTQIQFDPNTKKTDYDMDNVTTQYCIEAQNPRTVEGDMYSFKLAMNQSIASTISKPQSIDQSVDVRVMELKDTEVNTMIAMKGNKELLDASSSLTLVESSDVDTPTKTSKTPPLKDMESYGRRKVKISRSPVEIIYKIEEQPPVSEKSKSQLESASYDEEYDTSKTSHKAKKRIYSPSKSRHLPHQPIDVTPKPNTKMQKISCSPNIYNSSKMTPEKDVSQSSSSISGRSSKTVEKKSPRKNKDRKPGTSITVQQLISEYNVNTELDQHMNLKILEALNSRSETSSVPDSQSEIDCKSLELMSSFTSSKNAMKDALRTSTTTSSVQSQLSSTPTQPSRVDWHPELISGLCSKNLSQSDSAINVVAKIDMLPFMGSHECEWESSSGDLWSFRLLHSRIRLMVRLAHRHDNSTRIIVKGDTPVLDMTVETVQHDKKNPVATLCVRFACETMRYMVSQVCRGSCNASDIPPLLRRCAAVARVALRWGRAMHDAKLHLAYTLDNDGFLTLKVANIPLRSVWEVRMRVELVVENAGSAPWPRAGSVRVSRVVSDVCVADADVRRALANTPRDWGHAPRTIWRIFRYLKNKTRDDKLLLGS